jgi:hypothetical protein
MTTKSTGFVPRGYSLIDVVLAFGTASDVSGP